MWTQLEESTFQHFLYLHCTGPQKHQSAVTCLQFSGKFVVTSSDDGTVKLWDVETGKVKFLSDCSVATVDSKKFFSHQLQMLFAICTVTYSACDYVKAIVHGSSV